MKKALAILLIFAGWVTFALAGEQPAAPAAPKPLDPYTTTLPIYILSDKAAADGDLAEWAGIPPSAAEKFKPYDKDTLAKLPDDFAPMFYCGRKNGSPDLFLLIVVKGLHAWAQDDPSWLSGDGIEIYLDFGRKNRPVQDAEAVKKNNNWQNCPEMGQIGLRPRTFACPQKTFASTGAKNWKIDYAFASVEGGIAYEVRVDGKSVLDNLKLTEMPPFIGVDVGMFEQRYPVLLQSDGWDNRTGILRIFGDGMNHAFPIKYGMLSMEAKTADAAIAADQQVPKTLKSLYGEFPTVKEIRKAIGKLVPDKLADLVYWAVLQGAELDKSTVKKLMATGSPRVLEACLAAIMYTKQDDALAKTAVPLAYKSKKPVGAPALVIANLISEKQSFDYRDAFRKQLTNEDPTVAFTAARALAKIGKIDDVTFVQQTLDTILADLKKKVEAKDATAPGRIRAYTVFLGEALDTILARTTPIPVPKSVTERKIEADNADLPRHLPIDNNNVYNAKSLLRTWPKEGPKELWRAEIGNGLTSVVEVGGRAFAAGKFNDGNQYAWCFDAVTGQLAWKVMLKEKGGDPTITPLADADRVYLVEPVFTCLNAKDGTVVWKEEKAFAGTAYSTPLIVGDTLYIPASRPSGLVAVDKLTGKLRWNTPPGLTSCVGSPSYQIVEDIPQIIIGMAEGNAKPEVWGVNAQNGEVFWKRPFNGMFGLTSSPVAAGYRVYLCAGHAAKFSQCLQTFAKDGKLQARLAYHKDNLQTNTHNTVAVLDGCVYGFGGTGLQCSSIEDGKLLWEQKWPSLDRHLIVADGLIFAGTNTGEIVMAEASKAGYKELGRFQTNANLGGNTQQMTTANGRLYVRGEKHVVCYDLVNPKQ